MQFAHPPRKPEAAIRSHRRTLPLLRGAHPLLCHTKRRQATSHQPTKIRAGPRNSRRRRRAERHGSACLALAIHGSGCGSLSHTSGGPPRPSKLCRSLRLSPLLRLRSRSSHRCRRSDRRKVPSVCERGDSGGTGGRRLGKRRRSQPAITQSGIGRVEDAHAAPRWTPASRLRRTAEVSSGGGGGAQQKPSCRHSEP